MRGLAAAAVAPRATPAVLPVWAGLNRARAVTIAPSGQHLQLVLEFLAPPFRYQPLTVVPRSVAAEARPGWCVVLAGRTGWPGEPHPLLVLDPDAVGGVLRFRRLDGTVVDEFYAEGQPNQAL